MPSQKTFSDYLRLWFKWVLDPLGGFFNWLGITPNMMTMLGLLGNAVGAYYLARGQMLTGGLFVLLMTPIDALDGTMARLRGEASDFGAFVDSVTDRYSELIIYGGLLYHFLQLGDPLGGMLVFGAAAGSVLVSARPALPNTVFTSGTVMISRSVCCNSSEALAAEMPGRADGM